MRLIDIDKYIFFIALSFLPFFSFLRVVSDNNNIILLLPYILIGLIAFIFFLKNINLFMITILILLFVLDFYFFFYNNLISINNLIIINFLICICVFIYLYLKKNKNSIFFIDYLFIVLFLFGFILSFTYDVNEKIDGIINSLLNFRYYILNLIFYFFARIFIITKKDFNIVLYLLFFTSIFSLIYNFFEIILITNVDNINELENFYLGLKSINYFPHTLVNLNPFVISNYLPIGLQYNRLLSGYFYLIIFIIFSSYIFYYVWKNNLNLISKLIIYVFFSCIASTIIWYSKSNLLIFLSLIFILSLFLIYKKEIINLLLLHIFAVILPIFIISYVGIFNFKKNIIDELSYLINPVVFLPADVTELYCVNDYYAYCGFEKNSDFKFSLPAYNIIEEYNFNFKDLSSFLNDKNEFEFKLYFKKNSENKLNHLSFIFSFNLNKLMIFSENRKLIGKCNFDNCINLHFDNFKRIKNLSINNFNLNFALDTSDLDVFYFSIKDKYFFSNSLSFTLNDKFINILPKINSMYFECSIDKLIYSQIYVDNSACYKIPDNIIALNDENKEFVYLLNDNQTSYNFLNKITYVKIKTNVFYYFFKYLNIDIKKNSDLINKHGNIIFGVSKTKNNWQDKVIDLFNNNKTINNKNIKINDQLEKFDNVDTNIDLQTYVNLSTEADVPWLTFFYNYGVLTLFFLLALILPIIHTIKLYFMNPLLKYKLFTFVVILIIFSSIIALIHITVLFKISIAYIVYSLIGIVYNFQSIEKNA